MDDYLSGKEEDQNQKGALLRKWSQDFPYYNLHFAIRLGDLNTVKAIFAKDTDIMLCNLKLSFKVNKKCACESIKKECLQFIMQC